MISFKCERKAVLIIAELLASHFVSLFSHVIQNSMSFALLFGWMCCWCN